MDLNSLLMIATVVVFLAIVAILYMRSKNQSNKVEVETYNTMAKVLEAVKIEMVEIVKDDISLGLSNEEFDRLYKRKARINEALKNCVHGVDSAKALVIDLIRNFIANKVPPEQVTLLLGLDPESEPSNHVKFEILMYRYKKQYGKKALAQWITNYNFDRERHATGADRAQDMAYYITIDDLNMTYANENIVLDIEEQIDVLAILVYQQYKGFGILDTLREMDINGFNIGTSGSILTLGDSSKYPKEFKANNSVWIYFKGKYIHMRFMNFGSEDEARRIIQLICRWNNPGPLTAKRGYLVNTMYDKSRVLAVRPPVSEYWAVFIRKFTIDDPSPEYLIIKEYTHRGDLAIRLIEFLMRGCITCAVTGRQGSGKTTLMSSIVRYIDPRYTIRILEMAPELYLREIYPTRNILSLQETTTVTAAECQDALKKSDAAVSIVGEVATDSIAARMIQMGMTASIFTIFSHHANTPKDLVLTLRNSLVNDGGFSNMETAEKQVTDVVKCDIHLDYTPDGKRYIDRISEITQLDEGIPYPEYNPADPENSMNQITAEYYQRSTDRVGFTTRLILKYDLATHTYYTVDRFSQYLENRLRGNLNKELQVAFDEFMLREWGPRKENDGGEPMTEEEITERLEEMQDEIKVIDAKYKDIMENSGSGANMTFEKSDVQKLEDGELDDYVAPDSVIEEEAAQNEFWKSGYNPENSNEFDIGDFYSADDYS